MAAKLDDQNSDLPPPEDEEDEGPGSTYECNICLDSAKDPVISNCGHLFCWPCLYQWLETRPNRQICPVCKSGISKEKVIPLYGRGKDKKDPREKEVPPRPSGQRSEPDNTNFGGFGFGDGGFQVELSLEVLRPLLNPQMSFGIGAFPFTFLNTTVIGGGARRNEPVPDSPLAQEEYFLSKLFLWVAVIFMIWLLFVA